MTKEELAAKLNGREYGNEITKELESEANKSGLLVIYGASDDLVEFSGAFSDEADAIGGRDNIRVDKHGVLGDCVAVAEEWVNSESDEDELIFEEIKEYIKRREQSIAINAVFDEGGYTWVIKTDIPHVAFDIMEGENKFCKGIVIDLKGAAYVYPMPCIRRRISTSGIKGNLEDGY